MSTVRWNGAKRPDGKYRFFSKAIETKSFIPCNQSWSRAFRNVADFVSIASNQEKSASQGAKKGPFCMGILVTLSLSKKKAPIGRKKYFC